MAESAPASTIQAAQAQPPNADAAAPQPGATTNERSNSTAESAKCHLCDHDVCESGRGQSDFKNKDKYFELFVKPEIEEAHGVAGRIVKRLGLFGYSLFFVVPLAFVAIFYAIVPLGEPSSSSIREQWRFIFVSNLAVMALYAFLYEATFLSVAERERPFRVSLKPICAVLMVQLAFTAPVLLLNGVFDYLGIVLLLLFYVSLFFSLRVTYPELCDVVFSFFRRFILLLTLYIPILAGYIIAYRESSSVGQSGLQFALTFTTFIYRRIMLSRLDPFPLDLAQLLSGFWMQNIGDVVQIVAFPIVTSPGVFFATWLSNAFGNIAFLVFISDAWIFKIRPTLKNYVLNGIKCNFPIPPNPELDFSFDPLDRGHSANVGGYRRRQFRFFFFRVMSQAVSMLLYIAISPMLRFGLNRDFTPLGAITGPEYRNSMIYAATNLGFIFAVMAFGYGMLQKNHHQTFHEIRELHVHDLQNHTRVGLICAIITHNLVFAIGIVLQPYCIFSAFDNCRALV